MKKSILFLVLATLLLVGCAKEQPPAADTPEPAAHCGEFSSDYGTMTFSGDGESVSIDFSAELADAAGLPSGTAEGTYVFTFQNGMYRYDKADGFTITVGEQSCRFLNIFSSTDENTITLLSPIDDKSNLVFEKVAP